MKFDIDPESKVPIYVQIAAQVQAMVAAGQLRPGDQLPTIRQMATDLRINYNTVAHAYMELDRAGLIRTQRGKGTFVAGVPDEVEMARLRETKLQAILRAALDEARRLGYAPAEVSDAFRHEFDRWLQNEEG